MADANKTEKGTPHRREEAKKEGQVARARDLPGAVGLLAAIAVVVWGSGGAVAQWRHLLQELLDEALLPGTAFNLGLAQFRATFLLALGWSAVVSAAAWVCCAAVAFQGGFVFSAPALLKFNRLQPADNLKNMFSAASFSRTAKSVVPVGVMGYLTYAMLAKDWGELMRASSMSIPFALGWIAEEAGGLAWRGGFVLLAWSGVDYILQRRSHENSLKMTKQEVKDDAKETQGNPETRGRIRRIQRQMARRRMMQEVPHATVVVTNPTHYAVALRYEPGIMAAPVVVAKGQDLTAKRIRALAVKSGVPIVENKAVARALHAHVEIGAPIPGKLYQAVAEILAFLRRQQTVR